MRLLAVILIAGILSISAGANEYFPSDIGNWWDYDVAELDSLGNPTGFEFDRTTTLVGDTLINGMTYIVSHDSSNEYGPWLFKSQSFMRTSGDTLKMLFDVMELGQWVEADMAILPAPVGMTWTAVDLDTFYIQLGETIWVDIYATGEILDFGSITVPAGTFTDAYLLEDYTEIEFTIMDTTVTAEFSMEWWIARDVGPVYFHEYPAEIPGGFEPGYIEELVDYHVTAVEPEDMLLTPVSFAVDPPYPNPFNPMTTIGFDLPIRSEVTVTVADIRGSTVDLIKPGALDPGRYRYTFDGSSLSSGVYLVRIQSGQFKSIQKVVLMK